MIEFATGLILGSAVASALWWGHYRQLEGHVAELTRRWQLEQYVAAQRSGGCTCKFGTNPHGKGTPPEHCEYHRNRITTVWAEGEGPHSRGPSKDELCNRCQGGTGNAVCDECWGG